MDVSDAPELDSQDEEESEEREDERGGGAGPDAPTAVEENEAISTVLSGDALDGVQKDAGDG